MPRLNWKAGAAVVAGWMPDALMLAGATAVAYGAGLMYAPAGWIVGGLVLASVGYAKARAG